MKLIDVLTENEMSDIVPYSDDLRSQLIGKIQQLPNTKETQDLLKEIEDLLTDAGGLNRFTSITQQLTDLKDQDVIKGIKLLSRYIAGIPASSADRSEFLSLMKADKLIDQKVLTSSGKHHVDDIIPSSKNNKFIQELVYDLSQVSGYGVGKGEFLLSVLSRSITKGKTGDLEFLKLNLKIEVKTFHGGGGRFSDRNVSPSDNYIELVRRFFITFNQELARWGFEPSPTGMNLKDLISFRKIIESEHSPNLATFDDLIRDIIDAIFISNDKVTLRRKGYVYDNIIKGRERLAADTYVMASYSNYIALTGADGILMIDSAIDPLTFVFLKPSDKSFDYDLSFAANTIYPIARKNVSDAFPQSFIKYQSTANPKASEYKQQQLANPQTFKSTQLDTNTAGEESELEPDELDRIKTLATP